MRDRDNILSVCFTLMDYFLITNCSGLFVIIVKYSDIYL